MVNATATLKKSKLVIPAKAGIHLLFAFKSKMDPSFRWDDEQMAEIRR